MSDPVRLRELLIEALDGWESDTRGVHGEWCFGHRVWDHPELIRINEIRTEIGAPTSDFTDDI